MSEAAPRRRRLEPEDRRAEIVEAATRLIADRGFRGVTLQAVADACGMTAAGVLHHMGTKDGILVAVLEHRDAVDALAARERAAGETDPRGFLDAVMLRNSSQPEIVRLYSVLAAEALTESHPAHAYFQKRYAVSRADIERYLTGRVEDPAAAAVHVLAVMDGLQLQWLRDPDGFDLLHHWAVLADAVLGPRRAASRSPRG
ncbi:AcrR family transcriptional regulator [Motilibacter peucedani]|uniref:AcrR family transcriptional regulator n=1 Tax=Motilibacter peucedani TaxID=598650 RepID=A0A420XSZ6_9ACTN|nr:TetR family transcriptional regulator [Motilibacter peucedani]RKS79962.1 AcrR family transcriptional regulator [Motilibacter peucedani]